MHKLPPKPNPTTRSIYLNHCCKQNPFRVVQVKCCRSPCIGPSIFVFVLLVTYLKTRKAAGWNALLRGRWGQRQKQHRAGEQKPNKKNPPTNTTNNNNKMKNRKKTHKTKHTTTPSGLPLLGKAERHSCSQDGKSSALHCLILDSYAHRGTFTFNQCHVLATLLPPKEPFFNPNTAAVL